MSTTCPPDNSEWLNSSWDKGGNRTITVKDPAMYASNIELQDENHELREKVKRLEVTEKKYNVLRKLADGIKTDSARLFNVKALRKAMK